MRRGHETEEDRAIIVEGEARQDLKEIEMVNIDGAAKN
jgi:hypothetical protein